MKRKLTAIVLFIILILSTAGSVVWAEPASLATEENQTQLGLLLPESYEQYLKLTAPTDFALSAKYIAVADKTTGQTASIYILDRTGNVYKTFTFSTPNSITSLNFYSDGGTDYLFFVVPSNQVYYLDLSAENLTGTEQLLSGLAPSVMLINGNEIFYSKTTEGSSSLFHATLNGLAVENETDILKGATLQTGNARFSLYNGQVYVSENKAIHKCNAEGIEAVMEVNNPIEQFAMIGENQILYSDAWNDLYYNNNTNMIQTNCSVIKYYQGKVYVIYRDGISGIDVTQDKQEFNDYRIGKYSNTENRIGQDAKDISLWGNRLVIADQANRRVLIYDKTNAQSPYAVIEGVEFGQIVCAGKDTFAVSDTSQVLIYNYDGTLKATLAKSLFDSVIHSIAYSYGNYYIVGEGNRNAYVFAETGTDSSALKGGVNLQSAACTSITADIFGNLYVLQGASVYRYTTDTFGEGVTGEHICTFSEPPVKILCDYVGNIYACTADSILRYNVADQKITDFEIGTELNALVYNNGASSAVSIALSFENSEMYILSDGFIAKTESFGIASINNLSAEQTFEKIFVNGTDQNTADNTLVRAHKNCVGIRLDFSAFTKDSSVLPCGDYMRFSEEKTGTLLAETDDGVVVLFHDLQENDTNPITNRSYEIYLLPKGSDYESLGTQYYTQKGTNFRATVSNDVGLYKYPAMYKFRTNSEGTAEILGKIADLKQGTQVFVLGELNPGSDVLDAGSYSFILLKTDSGDLYGFVPTAYLIQTGEGATAEGSFVFRNLIEGATVTLYKNTDTLLLQNRERLQVYGEANESNLIFVAYVDADGNTYTGWIEESLLEKEDSSIIAVLVIVPLVSAVVLFSVCYLILRKQPTLQ